VNRLRLRHLVPALACAAGALAAPAAGAAALRHCDRPAEASPAEQDRLLRVAALIKAELAASGRGVALIARSGLDLRSIGVRYSHAGVALQASPNTTWSVRQLYYACDEARPRLFDQGLAGFLMGVNDPALGHISLVLLPEAESAALEHTALDTARALSLLGSAYSANAHPQSLRYQNCNQWLAELLAVAAGAEADAGDGDGGGDGAVAGGGPGISARAVAGAAAGAVAGAAAGAGVDVGADGASLADGVADPVADAVADRHRGARFAAQRCGSRATAARPSHCATRCCGSLRPWCRGSTPMTTRPRIFGAASSR
jgi:hypothetical protein